MGNFLHWLGAHPGRGFLLLSTASSALALLLLGLLYPPGPLDRPPYGPVAFSIVFPSKQAAPREPILSGGVKGTSYIVSVEQPAPGQVRFVYESWAEPEHVTPTTSVTPGVPYRLEIDLPQLQAPASERGVPFKITLNGNLVAREDVPYFPGAAKSLWVGTNPFTGPFFGRDYPGPPRPYAFSGQIRDITRSEAPSRLSFFAGRLFPNLRYEVEVAPHILYWSVLIGVLAALACVVAAIPPGDGRFAFLRRLAFFVTPVAITALPILPLLQISRTYRADWLNHGWFMEYYGQFLSVHHWLPRIVNSRQEIGMVGPVFYGHLLYAVGGLLSALPGGDVGIRLALFLALLCQTLCVRRTVWRLTGNLPVANAISALACWAIYPFSNLYGGSVMEFQAVCYLTCCLCIFVDLCQPGRSSQWLLVTEFAVFYALAANHPITGMLGALVLVIAGAAVIPFHSERGPVVRRLFACAALIAFLLSPWIYMFASHGHDVYIGRATTNENLAYSSFDTLLTRFVPFPFDLKSLTVGAMSEMSYADMQLNLPLFLAAAAGVFLVAKSGRRAASERPAIALAGVGICMFAWALIASVDPWVAGLSAALTNRLRYAFRLIDVQNLAILLVILACCWVYRLRSGSARQFADRIWTTALCSALLAVAAVSMLEKWTHGSAAVQQTAIGHSPQRALALPYTFYWLMDYANDAIPSTPANAPQQPATFPVSEGERFGEFEPVSVELAEPKYIVLNALASPLGRIYVDGSPAPPPTLARNGPHATVLVNPGKHRIEYRFEPGDLWYFPRTATEVLFFALALAGIVFESRKVFEITAVPSPSPSAADTRSPAYTS